MSKINISIECYFELNASSPQKLMVHKTSPPNNATDTYSVVACYGWAQKILCSDSYLKDANQIAVILAEKLNIPVETK